MARHSRWAACARTSKSESSGSTAVYDMLTVGGSASHRRCSAPRIRRTACQPSDARRRSPTVRSMGPTPSTSEDDTDRPIGTTVGRASGAQKIVCVLNDPCGSCAKAEAPSPPETGRHMMDASGPDHLLVVTPIVRIATKVFPGDAGDFGILYALVRLWRSPVEFRHCSDPTQHIEDCGAINSDPRGCRKSPIEHRARCFKVITARKELFFSKESSCDWLFLFGRATA